MKKNILCERIKLFNSKQRNEQSIKDFISNIRKILKYCNFPVEYADEMLLEMLSVKVLIMTKFVKLYVVNLPYFNVVI